MAHTDPVLALTQHLTPRDYRLLDLINQHRVLTTTHIGALLFSSPHARNARRRLLRLHKLGIIDRWRPQAPRGTAPLHWLLSEVGS